MTTTPATRRERLGSSDLGASDLGASDDAASTTPPPEEARRHRWRARREGNRARARDRRWRSRPDWT
jgi:hypothetical protein